MSNIIDMFANLKSDDDRAKFVEAAFVTIKNLNKDVETLRAQNKHLESVIKESLPAIDGTIAKEDSIYSPEEQICIEQIKMLKGFSRDREVTIEEARKLDIYCKILLQKAGAAGKRSNPEVDKKSVEELLKIVEDKPDNVSS